MKKLLLLIVVLVIFPSCYPYEGESICGDPVQCESDNDCIKEHGENFVCFNEREYYEQQNQSFMKQTLIEVEGQNCCAPPKAYCIEDVCKTQNIDCGTGECKLGNYGSYKCICNNNHTPCESGFKCNTEQKCVPICTNNDDCLKDGFTGDTCNTELNYCE